MMQAGQRGDAPASNVVGSGRDVMAQHKDGSSVHVFLTAERVAGPSCEATDYFLVGTMEKVPPASPLLPPGQRQ